MRQWRIIMKLSPRRIVSIYLVISALWIVGSDRMIAILFRQPGVKNTTHLQTIKGCVYVTVVAIILYYAIVRYTSEIYQSKKQLELNERRLDAIIETNADGILVFDSTGRITLTNAAAQKHLGLPRQQMIGCRYNEPIWQIQPLDARGLPENQLPFCQVMQKGRAAYEMEYAIARRDGTQIFVSINAAPLYDRQGQIDGVVAAITDITQHKQAEAVGRARDIAEARNRAKSEFLAQMSHEIRTPLNSILGLSQMLIREIFGSLNPKQKEYISRIKSSGDHLLELINDILDLSKVEAGKEELKFSEIPVPELCKYCLKVMQERAVDRGLRLTSKIDPEIRLCIADERRLKQMLLNLLSNAIKFTPKGEVSLIVEQQPGGIGFTVIDTGIGISEEHLPLVFDPFRQLDNELNHNIQGTGLGLALTRDLAQLHGGDVLLSSTLGVGSRFTIILPDPPPGYVPTVPSDELPGIVIPEAGDRNGRILIVDYDGSSTLLLQDYLQAVGHDVKLTGYSANFMEEVFSFDPYLILLDVQFAHLAMGLQLVEELRKNPNVQQLPVVVVTAMAMSGDRERCLAAGATDYLSKPIQLEILDEMLLRYIPPVV